MIVTKRKTKNLKQNKKNQKQTKEIIKPTVGIYVGRDQTVGKMNLSKEFSYIYIIVNIYMYAFKMPTSLNKSC